MKQGFIVVLLLLAQGCSWVALSPEGEKISVVLPQHVTSCKQLGKTTVSVKDKVAGVIRKDEKIEEELEMLARNNATSLQGADTIVPAGEIKDGQRTYNVYRCKK